MKMLWFAMGVTRKDKIRNEYIRATVKVERLGMKMSEGRLRWYGHVMKRDQEYVGVTGKEEKMNTKEKIFRYSKRRYGEVGAKETDIENRTVWKKMIRCGYP